MASWMRKLIGLTAVAVVASSVAFAGAAAAGTDGMPGGSTPPDPGCTFAVAIQTPDGTVPPDATSVGVVVTGAIGGDFTGAEVSLVVAGVAGPAQPVDADGTFTFGPLTVPVPIDVSISYAYGNENAYTNFCIGPGGTSVVRLQAGGAVVERGGALAFTGSSDATRNALIGVAALVLGTVLVVASRRRSRVRS